MKKKGFTIIELLAVIAILGIILTVAMISYGNVMHKSKLSIYKDEEKSLKGAAEGFMAYCATVENKPSFCIDIPESGETERISLDLLIQSNFINKILDPQQGASLCEGYVDVENVGTTTINITYKTCLKCSGYKSSDCE